MNSGLSSSAPIAFSFGATNKTPPAGTGGAGRKKILVVDDSVIFVKATSMMLKSAGYEVLTAPDGATAVSTARQLYPDLILLDLSFPPDVANGGGVAWDGLLIVSWLRRLNEAQHIPIIAITASDLAKCRDRCLAAGVLKVFSKPVDHAVLLATIQDALTIKA